MTAIHAVERTLFDTFQLHFHHLVCEGEFFAIILDHDMNVIDIFFHISCSADYLHSARKSITRIMPVTYCARDCTYLMAFAMKSKES